jgi:rSAM/selenodomain-associated transferase 1
VKVLGMFAKQPVAGITKTRLAAAIGNDQAARLSAAFAMDLIARLPGLADRFVIATTPRTQEALDWFDQVARPAGQGSVVWQTEGGLGDRIQSWFESQFTAGVKMAVLIGSDSPDLPDELVTTAFHELCSNDVVVAPSSDGGFVLIGVHRRCSLPDLAHCLRNVAWSTSATCSDTVGGLTEAGIRVKLLPGWYDVDTVEDLVLLADRLRGAAASQRGGLAERTRALLEQVQIPSRDSWCFVTDKSSG